MWNLVILAVSIVGLLGIRSAWMCEKQRNSLKSTLKSWGLNSDAMKYNAIYPSLGIKIASNYAIKAPVSIHNWQLDYSVIDTVKINANGFWAAKWHIEIDLKKADLLEAGKYELHKYLTDNNIISHNPNLY
jgi:hypothetical protein